ncbi:MAG: SGNH/GDSL hydrolase family protein [Paracoccaceae bacterium]
MRNVMCFGDSNTHGTPALQHPLDIRRFDRTTRWPGQMAAALGPDWHVIEEGLPSRTTVHDDPVEGLHKNGVRVLPALLDTHRPLDLVIVMLGTNDLKMRYNVPAIDIAISAEQLIRTIHSSIAGPDLAPPKALLVAPVPIEETGFLGEMFAGGAVKSQALAGYFQTIAERHGVGFLDAGTVADVDPVDGIHLTEDGHAALGRAIADKVNEMFG